MMLIIWLVIFFAFSTLLCLDRKKYTVFIYLCVFVVYALIITAIETPDTEAYRDFYCNINSNSDSYDSIYFEIGFQFLSKILWYLLHGNFKLYLAFLALLNMSILFVSCYRLYGNVSDKSVQLAKVSRFKLCFLSLLLYFSYYGLYYNAIVLRAGIALSIIMYLTTILRNKEGVRHLFLILILLLVAMLFHSSAIVGLLVLLVYYYSQPVSRSIYIYVLLFILILYFSGKGFLLICNIGDFDTLISSRFINLGRVNYYMNQISDSTLVSFNYIFNIFLAFIFVHKRNMPFFYYKYLNVFILGLAIIAFFSSLTVIARVADYFTFFSFVLSALYLYDLKRSLNFYLMSFLIIFIQLTFIIRIIL